MKARIASIVLAFLLVFTLASPATAAPVEQRAEPLVNCSQVRISTSQLKIVCSAAGIVVLNTVVNLPQAPPITLPPIPGPTIRVPGPTQTVTVPGPTQTETVNVPAPTTTVKEPGPTVTVTESALPEPNQTVTVSPSGQGGPSSDTLAPRDPVVTIPDIETVPQAIGLGLLATLGLMLLILLALWAGYILGFKDKERKDNDFFQALLDTVKAGKHR